jgi:hypothetical protein
MPAGRIPEARLNMIAIVDGATAAGGVAAAQRSTGRAVFAPLLPLPLPACSEAVVSAMAGGS